MKTTKRLTHTPGPWAVSIHEDDRYTNPKAWGVCTDKTQIIKTQTLTEDDASLISAAPDLLSSGKIALAQLSFTIELLNGMKNVPENVIAPVELAWEALGAAILKAEAR